MAVSVRLPSLFRGVPARLGAVVLVAGAFGGWAVWPSGWSSAKAPFSAPSLALAGKHVDRLAFAGDETEIPVREARIYDTIAMFALPQAEARPWSAAPIAATAREAGIRPAQLRPTAMPRLAAADPARKMADAARPVRKAPSDPAPGAAKDVETPDPVRVFGWNVPGSEHLPTRRDAALAVDKVGSGAAALGTGTVRVVQRSASALGSGMTSLGGVLADKLGLD